MRKIAIGIDLGTTNSAVGIWEQEKVELVENEAGTRLTPSYAYYSPKENCIGKMAVEKSGVDPQNVLFDAKRLLAQNVDSPMTKQFQHIWPFKVTGDPGSKNSKAYFTSVHRGEKKLIPPEKVSSDILKSLLNDVCRRLNVTKDDVEAVITVPAYFNMDQKRATMEAAKAAGINVKHILSEPVAAALAYRLELGGKKLKEGNSVFIFDLGGGTFDVTIMRIEDGVYKVIALGGDTHLGGRDFDRVIAEIIEKRLRKQLGDDKVNELMDKSKNRYKIMKIATEARESFTQTESETILLSGIHPDAENKEITRKEFEEKSQHLQDKIKKCCESTLQDAKIKIDIDPENIDHVLLVGGASKMKLVEKIMKDIFPGKTPLKTISGDEAIAKGATVYAAKLLGVSEDPVIKNLEIKDALPLSIGIEDKKNNFKAILEHNSSLPVNKIIEQKTTEDNQPSIKIPIYEGLSNDIDEDAYIGDIEVKEIPKKPAGDVNITISLIVDENGIFKIEVNTIGTNENLTIVFTYKMEFNFNMINYKMISDDKKENTADTNLGTTIKSGYGIPTLGKEEIEVVNGSSIDTLVRIDADEINIIEENVAQHTEARQEPKYLLIRKNEKKSFNIPSNMFYVSINYKTDSGKEKKHCVQHPIRYRTNTEKVLQIQIKEYVNDIDFDIIRS